MTASRASRGASPQDPGPRRIVWFASGTAATVALLFAYPTSTSSGSAGRPAALTPAAGPVTARPGGSTRTYNGSTVQTRWGPVQVQIVVENRRVTRAHAVVVPTGNRRDAEINSYAVPVLDAEAVQAQSARIDAVSGATVTSDGYLRSLQSALDAAGL